MIEDIIFFGFYSLIVAIVLYAMFKEHEEWEEEYRLQLSEGTD